jgi:hypothetical protein
VARSPLGARALVFVALLAVAFGPATRADAAKRPAMSAATRASLLQDAAWIEQTARPDGAIATNPDQRLVWPYLGNYAAMGLARAAAAGDARAASTVWRWLAWYQAHEDTNGYVADYVQTANGLQPSGTMDSTDAYAGTFLLATESIYQATGNRVQLARLRRGISGAVRAIESTQDADGLTWAKPSWHVKYLMDQAETYAGLVAAANVSRALGARSLSARAAADAVRLQRGVAKLWNPRIGAYDWAVHGDGVHAVTDWSVLYPDAMQQAWAVAFGLVDGSHARVLLDTLARVQPQWSSPRATATIGAYRTHVGYWGAATWAVRREGRSSAARVHAIRSAALTARRAWPFTSGDAGQLMVAEAPPLAAAPKGAVPAKAAPRARPAPAPPAKTASLRRVMLGPIPVTPLAEGVREWGSWPALALLAVPYGVVRRRRARGQRV